MEVELEQERVRTESAEVGVYVWIYYQENTTRQPSKRNVRTSTWDWTRTGLGLDLDWTRAGLGFDLDSLLVLGL